MPKEILNSKELINELYNLCTDKQFKKPEPLPEFTLKEALFIRDLIFFKPKDVVYFYLADHLAERTGFGWQGLFNSRAYRHYTFLKEYIICGGNATKAAVLSGYSRKSAKQQGYRVLRRIQGYFRD